MAALIGATPSVSSLAFPSTSANPLCFSTPSSSIKFHISFTSLNSPLSHSFQKFNSQLHSAVQEIPQQETQLDVSTEEEIEKKEKVIVVNLPWSSSGLDIKNLFSECGTVKGVEIIKHKNGKSRGFAFVTMGSVEEAQAAIDKFNAYEMSGRIIRVEFAKSLTKPSPPPPESSPLETGLKLYITNLSWKARASHLRELFSEFNPVSARVVFGHPSGGAIGYGFVSFATKEEAEAAKSSMDGKELMGRALRLHYSEKKVEEPTSEVKEDSTPDDQPKVEEVLNKPEE